METEFRSVVVFDLDGTLIDSRIDVAIAHNFAIKSVGAPQKPIEDIFELIGLSLEDTYKILLPKELHHLIDKASANYKGFYFEHCMDNTKPFDGTKEVLQHLKEQGFWLAVATTKRTFMAKRVLESAAPEILPLLDYVQGTDEFPHKPNPEIIRRVSTAIGKNNKPICMVGDTVMDIKTGKNAGIKTCAAMYGYGKKADLVAENPTDTISSITDLPEKIAKLELS